MEVILKFIFLFVYQIEIVYVNIDIFMIIKYTYLCAIINLYDAIVA